MQFPEVNDVIWWLGAIYGTCFAIGGAALLGWFALWLWYRTLTHFIPLAKIQRIVNRHLRDRGGK